MGKITKVETRTQEHTNHITGEVTTTTNDNVQVVNYGKTSDFVMTFTKDLGYMKDLSKGEIMVFFGMLKVVNNDNELILNKSIKNRICQEFDIKPGSINVLISNLKKKGVIFQKEQGVYLLNTFLFGKGNWGNIKKQRMLIEWDFKTLEKKVIIEQDFLNEEEIIEKQIKEQEKLLEKLKKEKKEKEEINLFNMEENNE